VQLDQMLVTAIFLLLGIGTATWADEPEVLQLHPDPSLWRTIVSKVKAVPESEAAHFAFPEDSEKGTCLAVGPWRDGLYSARFEYREKIPHLRVTVRGSYRTEKLGIYGGVVQFVYLKDGSYVSVLPRNGRPSSSLLESPPQEPTRLPSASAWRTRPKAASSSLTSPSHPRSRLCAFQKILVP